MQQFERRKSNAIATMFLIILGLIIICFLVYSYTRCIIEEDSYTNKKYNPDISQYETYKIFFKHHGSPVPSVMAMAVQEVKPKNRPKIAAIAAVESNGRPWAVGDKGASKGAWQVQGKHWGKVPMSAVEQALQAERILEELVASEPRGSLRCALAKYNGGTKPPAISYRYAARVIELKKVLL